MHKQLQSSYRLLKRFVALFLPKHRWLRRAVITGIVILAITFMAVYTIGLWYTWSIRTRPLVMGNSFVADYAASLGIDPHETFLAMLDDLHIRHVRLVSYWSDIEARPGHYDFTELDWEFQQAVSHQAHVTLGLGLRQPRWPECHMPTWAENEPQSVWQPQLEQFIATVVERYRTSPALESYQLENEYFLRVFGTCTNFSRQRLITETNLVRKLDPHHTLIISRSDNAVGWPVRDPKADEYAISIYRRVWTPILQRYIQYPHPAWYYAFLAGMEKIWSGRDTVIHELQAEPWTAHGRSIPDTPLAEQNKSLNAKRLRQTVIFGRATGMRSIDLWGAEYWYYRKVTLHDSSVWDAAKDIYENAH